MRLRLTVTSGIVLIEDSTGTLVGGVCDPNRADSSASLVHAGEELFPEGLIQFLVIVNNCSGKKEGGEFPTFGKPVP